jgi:hypothetical protein
VVEASTVVLWEKVEVEVGEVGEVGVGVLTDADEVAIASPTFAEVRHAGATDDDQQVYPSGHWTSEV